MTSEHADIAQYRGSGDLALVVAKLGT